jgi:hypothetical protein
LLIQLSEMIDDERWRARRQVGWSGVLVHEGPFCFAAFGRILTLSQCDERQNLEPFRGQHRPFDVSTTAKAIVALDCS